MKTYLDFLQEEMIQLYGDKAKSVTHSDYLVPLGCVKKAAEKYEAYLAGNISK
jgi:hypothetical protein